MGARTPGPDDEQDPTSDADDVDARFAEITASLGAITVPPADPDDRLSEEPTGPPDPAQASTGPPPSRGPRDYVVEDDHDDGFTPPEPEPLSPNDPVVAIGWVAVLVPLVLVLVYLMFWRGMPAGLLGLAGVAFVLGVGVLVWRMPSRRSPEDDDDGAVV